MMMMTPIQIFVLGRILGFWKKEKNGVLSSVDHLFYFVSFELVSLPSLSLTCFVQFAIFCKWKSVSMCAMFSYY